MQFGGPENIRGPSFGRPVRLSSPPTVVLAGLDLWPDQAPVDPKAANVLAGPHVVANRGCYVCLGG